MTQQITGKFLKNSIEFLDLGLQPLANNYQEKSQKKKTKKNIDLKFYLIKKLN